MVSQLGGMDDTLCDKIVKKIHFDLFFFYIRKIILFFKKDFHVLGPNHLLPRWRITVKT